MWPACVRQRDSRRWSCCKKKETAFQDNASRACYAFAGPALGNDKILTRGRHHWKNLAIKTRLRAMGLTHSLSFTFCTLQAPSTTFKDCLPPPTPNSQLSLLRIVLERKEKTASVLGSTRCTDTHPCTLFRHPSPISPLPALLPSHSLSHSFPPCSFPLTS